MKARIETKKDIRTDVGYETSKFVYGVGLTAAALIGLWGAACLIGGLADTGIGGLVNGFVIAVTGI